MRNQPPPEAGAEPDPLGPLLAGLRVVLVQPKHPGNIGACARVMMNMGIGDLVVVAPRCDIDREAWSMAAGAAELLERARIVDDLDEALAGVEVAAALTARSRSLRWPVRGSARFATDAAACLGAGQRVAMVFGPERTGLLNEHLARCTELVTIDANPAYPSLNLASAVQVLSYAVRQACEPAEPAAVAVREYPKREFVEAYLRDLGEWLEGLDFIDGRTHLEQTMQKLRAMLSRAEPDRRELQLLHGILSTARKRDRGKA